MNEGERMRRFVILYNLDSFARQAECGCTCPVSWGGEEDVGLGLGLILAGCTVPVALHGE
jgi:hypothetical protein